MALEEIGAPFSSHINVWLCLHLGFHHCIHLSILLLSQNIELFNIRSMPNNTVQSIQFGSSDFILQHVVNLVANQCHSKFVHLNYYVSQIVFMLIEILYSSLLLHKLFPFTHWLKDSSSSKVLEKIFDCLTLKASLRLCKLKSKLICLFSVILFIYSLTREVYHLLFSVHILSETNFVNLCPPMWKMIFKFCKRVYPLPNLVNL